MARRGIEKAEVESLNEALEGAALENQGLHKVLVVKDQRMEALEKQTVCLLGKLAASREEVETSRYFQTCTLLKKLGFSNSVLTLST